MLKLSLALRGKSDKAKRLLTAWSSPGDGGLIFAIGNSADKITAFPVFLSLSLTSPESSHEFYAVLFLLADTACHTDTVGTRFYIRPGAQVFD